MQKIKRSRIVKIISFILAVFFIFSAAVSAAFAIFAFNTRGAGTISDDIFNSIYEELSRMEARRLVSSGLMREYLDGGAENFLKNYAQFTKGHTNFSFTIKDENGKELFSNFKPSKTLPGYTWESYYYIYDTDYGKQIIYDDLNQYYVGLYEYAQSPSKSEITEPSSAPQGETWMESVTDFIPSEENTEEESQSEVTTEKNEETENTTAPEPPQGESAAESKNPVIKDNEQVYIVDDRDEGFDSIFMYIYPAGEFRNEIYSYCYMLYRDEYEPVEAQYYRNGMYEVYHQTDFATSENGYVYFIGEEREKPSDNYYPEPEEKHLFHLVVKPDAALEVKDIVYYTALAKQALSSYINHIASYTIWFMLAAVLFIVLSLFFAGYVKDEDGPVARGIHKIPTDLLIIMFVAAAVIFAAYFIDYLLYGGYYYNYLVGSIITLTVPLLLIYFCLYLFAVKVKTHTVVSSVLFVKIFRWFKKLIREASNALNVLWKLGIVYVLTGVISVIVIIASNYETGIELVIYIVFKVIELIPLLLVAANLHTLQSGAKNISEGKLKHVANRFLFGEFRKNAEYLNNINNGINIAVEERLKSESTKTELITNVSHDIKTPLTSIVNYIDLLKKEKLNNPKATEYIEVIDRQSQRLKKLTTDIVDASKAAAGSMELNMENTGLNVLLGQVKGEYSERLTEKHLTLIDSIPEESISVYADGRLLWRVFDNLMNNICKYSLENTRVYLSLKQKNDKVEITFRNISAEELPTDAGSLTERFVRGDASRGTEGSGLGLYIAKSLTENMGGHFSVSTDGDLFKAVVEFDINN